MKIFGHKRFCPVRSGQILDQSVHCTGRRSTSKYIIVHCACHCTNFGFLEISDQVLTWINEGVDRN